MSTSTETKTHLPENTSDIELKNVSRDPVRLSEEGRKLSDLDNIRNDVNVPEDAVEALQKWNEPRINMWRVFATYFSFFVFGMNDGAYGVSFFLSPQSQIHS